MINIRCTECSAQYTSEARTETVAVARGETQVVATIPAGKEQVFVQLDANADIGTLNEPVDI